MLRCPRSAVRRPPRGRGDGGSCRSTFLGAHQLFHARVGLHLGAVDAEPRSREKPGLAQGAQREGEDLLVDLVWQALADHREDGVVGRGLGKVVAQESPHRHGVLAARDDAALAAELLEVAHHEHLEVDLRIDGRAPAATRMVERSGESAHEIPGAFRLEVFDETVVEGFRPSRADRIAAHPELVLARKTLLADHSER